MILCTIPLIYLRQQTKRKVNQTLKSQEMLHSYLGILKEEIRVLCLVLVCCNCLSESLLDRKKKVQV